MSQFSVLLDANVLIPAALRDTLLRASWSGLYQVRWSDTILDEVQRNLVASGMTTEGQARRLIATLRRSFPESLVQGYEVLIPDMTNHPGDRHVMAAAVMARVRTIVTFNLRHFHQAALAPHGIEAQHPDVFLSELASLVPDLMARAIEEQAAALRNPPKRYDDILDNLTGQVPRFAALMRGLRQPSD